MLDEAAPLRDLVAGSLVDVRMSWFEGYIHTGRGDHKVAINLLARAREGLLHHDLPYEAAWVAMDLATAYLETGDAEAALSLLPASIPVFQELGAQKKLQKAIKLLEGSVRLSVAKAALLELQDVLAKRCKRRFLP